MTSTIAAIDPVISSWEVMGIGLIRDEEAKFYALKL